MGHARELFESHHLGLFRFLHKMTGSHDLAEDLLQETFLRVARARPGHRGEGHERAWLFRIARNVFLTRRRDESRRPQPEGLAEEPPGPSTVRPWKKMALEHALAQLQHEHREAFLLREIGGLSYAEIAAACDVTPDAVRNRIFRARTELRRRLAAGPRGEVRRFPKERTS
jgi:RNA polymerase sigma-70 factor (ECF subfamily)